MLLEVGRCQSAHHRVRQRTAGAVGEARHQASGVGICASAPALLIKLHGLVASTRMRTWIRLTCGPPLRSAVHTPARAPRPPPNKISAGDLPPPPQQRLHAVDDAPSLAPRRLLPSASHLASAQWGLGGLGGELVSTSDEASRTVTGLILCARGYVPRGSSGALRSGTQSKFIFLWYVEDFVAGSRPLIRPQSFCWTLRTQHFAAPPYHGHAAGSKEVTRHTHVTYRPPTTLVHVA